MKTKILNLKNNVKLIHTYTKDVNGVEMEFTFKAGSLNDPKGKEGLAHFCEHALIYVLFCFGKGYTVLSQWYFMVKTYKFAILLPKYFFDKVIFFFIPCFEVVLYKSAGITRI